MENWEKLFEMAMKQLEASRIPDDAWSFGGGTAIMMKLNHRYSKDVDIFLKDAQYVPYLSPRLNDALENDIGRYDEQSNFIRLFCDEGQIDFISSSQVTSITPIKENVCGHDVYVQDPVEIIARKIRYRVDTFKPRDVFDLAAVYRSNKSSLLKELKFIAYYFEALVNNVDKLNISGELEKECGCLSLLSGGKRIRGKEYEIVQDFFNEMRRLMDRIAEQDLDSRAVLSIPKGDEDLARELGIRRDYAKKEWFAHKERLFELPEKWGGREKDGVFFSRAQKFLKEQENDFER